MQNSCLHAKEFQFSHKSAVRISGFIIIYTPTKTFFPPSSTCCMPEQKVRQRSLLQNTAFYQRGVSSKDKLIRDRVISLWKTDGRRVSHERDAIRAQFRVPGIFGVCSQCSEISNVSCDELTTTLGLIHLDQVRYEHRRVPLKIMICFCTDCTLKCDKLREVIL